LVTHPIANDSGARITKRWPVPCDLDAYQHRFGYQSCRNVGWPIVVPPVIVVYTIAVDWLFRGKVVSR
jgi:hypothetical protein